MYVCIYIYTYPSNLFFPSWYFSPSLPLQAAVAAAANTSSVTSATAGATGVPGGHPQGAPGSHSPGPASYNILSVNEGTDWTDGYLLGKFLQSYSFSVTYLSLEVFCFLDLLSYLPFFCLTFSSLSPSHLYSYIFISPLSIPFSVCSLVFSLALDATTVLSLPYLHSISYLSPYLFFCSYPSWVSTPHFSFLAFVLFFPAASVRFSSQVSSSSLLPCLCPCFGPQRCLSFYLSVRHSRVQNTFKPVSRRNWKFSVSKFECWKIPGTGMVIWLGHEK